MNLLISGIGSDIGFNAGRIIRDWGLASRLFGLDIHTEHPGMFVFDVCDVAPRASDSGYVPWLLDYIRRNRIDVFLPSSEAEISRISQLPPEVFGDTKVLISNTFAVEKSLDKYLCMVHLSRRGLAVPKNGLVGDSNPQQYPVVVKPRSGQGSKGIFIINDDVKYELLATKGHVWQELLGTADQEFTCAVYRSDTTDTRLLILRRKLQGGLTSYAEVVDDPDIENYVRAIAEHLQLRGVINVQLRKTLNGPVLFEINPRLSSTVMFRDKLGFSDLKWWVLDNLCKPVPSYVKPRTGARCFRGSQEYIFET